MCDERYVNYSVISTKIMIRWETKKNQQKSIIVTCLILFIYIFFHSIVSFILNNEHFKSVYKVICWNNHHQHTLKQCTKCVHKIPYLVQSTFTIMNGNVSWVFLRVHENIFDSLAWLDVVGNVKVSFVVLSKS